MRDVKRRIETYSLYDRSAISSHLEAMAAKGWQLERMSNLTWTYRRAQPQKLHYAVTYYPSGSAFDPEPNSELEEFYELCEHEGWEYVTGFAEMQIFENSRGNPTTLETDPAVELETIHKSAKRRLLTPYWILFAICVVFAFLGLGKLFTDPVYALSGLYSVPAGVCSALCAAALAVELVGYYRWRSRAREAAAHGESVETKSPYQALRVLLILALAALAVMLLCMFIVGDNYMRFTICVILGVYIIGSAIMRASTKLFKRRGSSKTKTMVLSVALVFAVCFALYSASAPTANDLGEEFYSAEEDYVNSMLTLAALVGHETPGYMPSWSKRESVLLAQRSVRDWYRESYYTDSSENIGALEYTTTFVKLPALYGFCERTASRGGENVDPAPWGALRAYSMGGDAYTLCYDGRIVEISLPFTPTDEQMAIVDEKLGA